MKGSMWVALVVCVLVAACGQGGGGSGAGGTKSAGTGAATPPPPPPPPSGPPVCSGPVCSLTVTVTGTPPEAKVAPKKLRVDRGNRDATMVWELASADYEFRDDSIKFTDSTCAAEFKDMKAIANGKRYHAINGNVTAKECDYTGQVYKRSGGSPVALDPAIINDGI